MNEAKKIKRSHWVVVGRMCGDDDDHGRFYVDCTREEALACFRDDVYESEGYTLEDREQAEAAGEGVFVMFLAHSDSPITQE